MSADAQDPFVKGQRIDRYEIREHIAQGGMGAVYRAIDSKLGRTVALKTVVAHRRGDALTDEIRERFMREALAASRVDHRNVVQVLDFGFADDGTPYMVMEYLRGRSLSALLKTANAPLAIDHVADVMLSVCAALRACHHVGIIHRDLKPANIFLCDTDTGWEVKVLDFGISKAPAADDLTQDGQIIGTPQYLSPEQIEGTVGPESDQYALGVLMYVSLTGRLPYAGYQGVRLLRAIAEGTFDPPRALRPDLPEALEAIVLRAMHVSPKQRFESIHALGQRLWDFASARGQAQWRPFYFHTPAAPQPTAATTGTTAPSRSDGARPIIDSTASLGSGRAPADADRDPETVGPSHFAATRTVARSGVGDATSLSHSDIAGESALGDTGSTGGGRPAGRSRRWPAALVVAGVAVLGFAAVRQPWRAQRPPQPIAARTTAAANQSPAASAVQPAQPSTTAPKPPPTTVPVAAPAPPAAVAPIAPTAKTPPRPPLEASRKKHATRRHKLPKLDQHGIGIPAE